MGQILTGHFEADGNDVDLPLGFIPDHLELVNSAAADGEVIKIEWWRCAGVGKELHFIRHANDAGSDRDTPIWETSGEIEAEVSGGTVYNAGDPNLVKVTGDYGVTIDASFMDDSDEIYYTAIRADRDTDHGDINA